jgi:hypothetical protein
MKRQRLLLIVATLMTILMLQALPSQAYTAHITSVWRISDLSATHRYYGVATNGHSPSTWNNEETVFARLHPYGGNDSLYIASNGCERYLTEGTTPCWSPDGQWIVYVELVGKPGDNADIYKIRPDGTQRTMLVGGPGAQMLPSWSYDGKYIVYVHNDIASGISELRIMDANGYHVRTVISANINEEYMTTPAFTPDGRSILYASSRGLANQWIVGNVRNTDIWITDIAGTVQQRITFDMDASTPTMRQDGLIAFETLWPYKSASRLLPNTIMNGHIYITRIGGPIEPLFASYITRMHPKFSYDGTWLYFAAAHN